MIKKEKLRSQKGITLIALVVTIVVLIILAGVSINLVLGDNGIITKAREGRTNYQIAANEEQEELDNAGALIDSMVGEAITVEYNYDNPYIPTGFKYKEGTWNNGYTIIGETESVGNEFVWVPCVTDQSKVKSGDTVVTFGIKTDDTKYKPSNMTITGEEGTTAGEIEASVATYGGFYIAKYEAGISGTTENYSLSTKTATNGSVKPLSKPGCGVWNYILRADAITVSKAMIDNATTGAKSALISGACWDTTLQWIVNASDNKDNEPNLGYDINSKGNGWYSDVSNGTRHLTGYYAVNNIYDMAGNVYEYTTENCASNGNSYVVNRGSGYDGSGSDYPAARRGFNADYAYYFFAFRVVLYK